MSSSLATATIDLASLRSNYTYLKNKAPLSKALAVIKADAYGHGMLAVASALKDGDGFAVARLEEALSLRENNFNQKILLLEGVVSLDQLELALANGITLVFHHSSQLAFLKEYFQTRSNPKEVSIWLKVNTGMNRLGFTAPELLKELSELNAYSGLSVEVLMTHFACAELDDRCSTKEAIEKFNEVKKMLSLDAVSTSCANSAAILAFPESHGDWLRPGIAMYGAPPIMSEQNNFKTVMSLKSQVISIYEIAAGESVGYGATWVAPQNTRVAVIGIGYGDGYPRHAQAGTPVLINGTQYPLIGRVSMDMISVELGLKAEAKVGDEVILWGEDGRGSSLSVEIIAQAAGTISYELYCGITQRVCKEYVGG